MDSTNENQAYKRTVYLLEDHKVKLISIIFHEDHLFPPDDTEIRTNEKTLRLIVHTGTTTPGLYIPSGTTLLDHNARPAQISPAIYSPAAQRSAVRSRGEPYGALPCPSLWCCVVLRCVLSFEHRAVPVVIRVVVMCYFYSFFFFYMYLIFHGPLFFPPRKLPPYCRSKRNTGNKSTQHS